LTCFDCDLAGSQGAFAERAFDRGDDRGSGGLLAEMFQHHRAGPDHADRIGDALAGVDFPGKRSLIGTQTGRLEFAGLRIIRIEAPIDNRYTEDHKEADEHWPVKRS
jgi:hypothetical protein